MKDFVVHELHSLMDGPAAIVGTFDSYEEALVWKELGPLSHIAQEWEIVELSTPDGWVSVQLGPEPGQFSPEGAAELLDDLMDES